MNNIICEEKRLHRFVHFVNVIEFNCNPVYCAKTWKIFDY